MMQGKCLGDRSCTDQANTCSLIQPGAEFLCRRKENDARNIVPQAELSHRQTQTHTLYTRSHTLPGATPQTQPGVRAPSSETAALRLPGSQRHQTCYNPTAKLQGCARAGHRLLWSCTGSGGASAPCLSVYSNECDQWIQHAS